MRYDALIIGAGMSGLAAGIRLAQAGKRVAILERHSLWGGLNSFYKRGGRRFDTGLHALTNFVPRGTPGAPLTKILRQLRLSYDALALAPQRFSQTAFQVGGQILRLSYSNDVTLMRAEVARLFPGSVAGFERMLACLPSFTEPGREDFELGARAKVNEFVGDPLLSEMLLTAPLYYGSAREDDLSWADFAILFRSIHLEGMARPDGGIKRLLDLLVGRFRDEGGELRMRNGVQRIEVDGGAARGVVLDDGVQLECDELFSSAGLVETKRLCGDTQHAAVGDVGRLSFFETCSILTRPTHALGYEAAITFFVDGERNDYRRPESLVATSSGVIASADNYGEPRATGEGILRVTGLAHHGLWTSLPQDEYARAKERCTSALLDAAAPFALDPRPHTIDRDAFTPRTIEHYTGHLGGAVYGSPRKQRDGGIGVAHLHLIGTDQGLVGIVGALLSGITIANRTLLVSHGGAA
jgi:phytoene dehydrogenase-like protein